MNKEKNVDIVLECDDGNEKIQIPLELFTRIDYMARCQKMTFEELFIKIIEEEGTKDEKSN